jgi:hypothetical protein
MMETSNPVVGDSRVATSNPVGLATKTAFRWTFVFSAKFLPAFTGSKKNFVDREFRPGTAGSREGAKTLRRPRKRGDGGRGWVGAALKQALLSSDFGVQSSGFGGRKLLQGAAGPAPQKVPPLLAKARFFDSRAIGSSRWSSIGSPDAR